MTPTKRRAFLQIAGLVPAAAVVGVAAPRDAVARAPDATFTRSAFARCLGDNFTFETSVFGQVVARLATVEAHAGCRTSGEREGRFSLRFEARGDATLEQASYRVHHARLGEFVLFVSPGDATGRSVEAVFNRL